MDTIECNACHKNCVPRLWTYSPLLGPLRYARTQHNCPFCGNVMYETGGQFKLWGLFFLFCLGLLALGIALLVYFPSFHSGFLLQVLFEIGFWGAIVAAIYKFARRSRRR